MHMSNKVRTTLTLDRTVIKRAKELDINISAAAERGIIEYIKEMESLRSGNNNSNKHTPQSKNLAPKERTVTDGEMGSLRFELKTSAMSRRRHNQLDHEPV